MRRPRLPVAEGQAVPSSGPRRRARRTSVCRPARGTGRGGRRTRRRRAGLRRRTGRRSPSWARWPRGRRRRSRGNRRRGRGRRSRPARSSSEVGSKGITSAPAPSISSTFSSYRKLKEGPAATATRTPGVLSPSGASGLQGTARRDPAEDASRITASRSRERATTVPRASMDPLASRRRSAAGTRPRCRPGVRTASSRRR